MHSIFFNILSMVGVWRPISATSPNAIRFYNLYTIISQVVFYTFMISEILDLVFLAENVQQITENMIQLINIFNVSQKSLSYLVNRSKILKLLNMLNDDLIVPSTDKEKSIQKKFERQSSGNAKKLCILYTISVCSVVYMPYFVSDIKDRVLPYRVWLPYSLENVNYYRLTYLHHSWAVSIAASVNGATELLISSFMIRICAQFEVLEERFMELPKKIKDMRNADRSPEEIEATEKTLITRLIHHHKHMYSLAGLLNEVFVFVILSQFITSITVLCVSTYNLALLPVFSVDFIAIFLYLLCMLLQIFMYTWYGNEITNRSMDMSHKIFLSNWRELSRSGIKDLLILSERAKKPILLSSGYVIILSNTAFTSIVKTSYSVYNVLSV